MSTHPFDNDGMVEFDHWVPSVKKIDKIMLWCAHCSLSLDNCLCSKNGTQNPTNVNPNETNVEKDS